MITVGMELRWLRYFIAVADELHFTRAATNLHIAQPALSQQIRALEREIGTELLIRTKHSVRLTEAGRVFLEHARRVVDEAELARTAAQRAARGEQGRLVVAFIPSVAGDLVPAAIRAYRASFPDVEVLLQEANTAQQVAGLLRHDVHVGVMHDEALPDRLDTRVIRQDRFVAALPAGHRLAVQDSVALEDLASEPFIGGPTTSPDSHYTALLRQACAEAGFTPIIAHQTGMSATREVLIAAGLGVALIVESARHLHSRDILYRPLRGQPITIAVRAAWSKDLHSPLVPAFVAALRASTATATETSARESAREPAEQSALYERQTDDRDGRERELRPPARDQHQDSANERNH